LQSTRGRILNILKEHGQATVDDLSQELGLTAVTVRHHLDVLRGDGLIAPPIVRRRKTPGRPQYVYSLAERAGSIFPKRYEHLAQLMLEEVRACLPPDEVAQMMERIGKRIARQAHLPRQGSFEDRLSAVVEFLNDLGYMAHWERDGGGYLLHAINCPYEKVSRHDQEICDIDLALLTQLLGVSPERVAWTAWGDSHCIYAFGSAE
jgi:DeoR family suf operon transcriptional repressor